MAQSNNNKNFNGGASSMPTERKIIGLPCVGGKSKLAPYLCDVIEQVCTANNIKTYVSACGGGGKDIFSLNADRFDELIYNEFEKPLCTLVKVLSNIDDSSKLKAKVNELFDEAVVGIDKNNTELRDERMRKLFKEAYTYAGDDELTMAAYGVILIFGSVQNNRQQILLREKNGRRDFYEGLRVNAKYESRLENVYKKAQKLTEVTNEDCIKVVEKYKDREDVFIYIDPPYWNSQNDYKNTFNFDKHIELAKVCQNAKCKIMISMHELGLAPYIVSLHKCENWYVYETPSIPHSSARTNAQKIRTKRSGDIEYSPDAGLDSLYDNIPFMQETIEGLGAPKVNEMREFVYTNFKFAYEDFNLCIPNEYGDFATSFGTTEDYIEAEDIKNHAVRRIYKEKKHKLPEATENELCLAVWNSLNSFFNAPVDASSDEAKSCINTIKDIRTMLRKKRTKKQ